MVSEIRLEIVDWELRHPHFHQTYHILGQCLLKALSEHKVEFDRVLEVVA